MSDEHAVDMIRWTFTADPSRGAAIESFLNDLGLDVSARGDGQFVATWEEPEEDLDAVVERLWVLNGAPFEVTHEAFRRLDLLVYHAEHEPTQEAA